MPEVNESEFEESAAERSNSEWNAVGYEHSFMLSNTLIFCLLCVIGVPVLICPILFGNYTDLSWLSLCSDTHCSSRPALGCHRSWNALSVISHRSRGSHCGLFESSHIFCVCVTEGQMGSRTFLLVVPVQSFIELRQFDASNKWRAGASSE